MDVAERAHAIDVGATERNPPDVGTGEPEPASRRLPQQAEWRWSPDPAEVDVPTPPSSPDAGSWGALIRALAWATLHHGG